MTNIDQKSNTIKSKMIRTEVFIWFGSLSCLYGFYAALACITMVANHTMSPDERIPGIMFWGTVGVISGILTRIQFGEKHKLKELRQEQAILTAAKSVQGRCTSVPEFALHTQLSIADTKKALGQLGSLGICELQVDERGMEGYVFPCFENMALENMSKTPQIESSEQ